MTQRQKWFEILFLGWEGIFVNSVNLISPEIQVLGRFIKISFEILLFWSKILNFQTQNCIFWLELKTLVWNSGKLLIWNLIALFYLFSRGCEGLHWRGLHFRKSRFQNLLITTALIFTAVLECSRSQLKYEKFRAKFGLKHLVKNEIFGFKISEKFPKKNFYNLSCILFRFGMASAGMILIRLSVRMTSWTYQGRPSGMWTNFASSSVCTHWALLSCSSQMHPDGHWDWAKGINPINIVSIMSKQTNK